MTEHLFYECDVCTARQEPFEALSLERQLGEMLDPTPDGPAHHLCVDCHDELRKLIAKWVHEKNE